MLAQRLDGETQGAARGGAMRSLGPIIVMQRLPVLGGARRDVPLHADAVALQLLAPPSVTAVSERGRSAHTTIGGVLFSLSSGKNVAIADDGLVLLLPRRLVSALMPGRITELELPHSAALDVLRRLSAALLEFSDRMSERQARLAGSAVCELLSAALTPCGSGGMTLRRGASLLARVIDWVDHNLAATLDAAALCKGLNCSRSALYRAVEPAGGVIVLVTERRLTAVYDRLCDPSERGSIAAVARECGFADAAQFSRSFKRSFGITAGELRRQTLSRRSLQ